MDSRTADTSRPFHNRFSVGGCQIPLFTICLEWVLTCTWIVYLPWPSLLSSTFIWTKHLTHRISIKLYSKERCCFATVVGLTTRNWLLDFLWRRTRWRKSSLRGPKVNVTLRCNTLSPILWGVCDSQSSSYLRSKATHEIYFLFLSHVNEPVKCSKSIVVFHFTISDICPNSVSDMYMCLCDNLISDST